MSLHLTFDFSKPENCWQWLKQKAPLLGWNVVAFFGKTSSGKTSLMCALGPDAQIAEVKPESTTSAPHFVLGLPDDEFQAVSTRTVRGEALSADVLDAAFLPETDAVPRAGVRPMSTSQRWPVPSPECRPGRDPRYGDLYVQGSGLEGAFRRVLPSSHHSLLAGAQLSIYNVDRVTDDADRKKLLKRTLFVDTKGLDTREPSPGLTELMRLPNAKLVYCLPPAHADNAVPAGAFETMRMEAAFGKDWRGQYAEYFKNAVSAASPLLAFAVNQYVATAAVVGAEGLSAAAQERSAPDAAMEQRLWRHTTFVRGRLDEALQSVWGYETAVQDAGTALGYFVTKPVNKRVRHVAVPRYAKFADPVVMAARNELEAVREELLDPALDADATGASLCESVAAFRAHCIRHPTRTWARYAPRWVANTDKFYADQIWDLHCKNAALRNAEA